LTRTTDSQPPRGSATHSILIIGNNENKSCTVIDYLSQDVNLCDVGLLLKNTAAAILGGCIWWCWCILRQIISAELIRLRRSKLWSCDWRCHGQCCYSV